MSENIENMLAIWTPQGWEWIIILVIALIIFGGKLPEMLPKIARSLGKSLHEFKKGVKEVDETKDEVENEVKKVKDDLTKDVYARDDVKKTLDEVKKVKDDSNLND